MFEDSRCHCRGGPLECGLRRVVNAIPIGSLLIQSEAATGEQILLHLQLPICLRHRHLAEQSWVFLLDAQVCRCHQTRVTLSSLSVS